MTDENDESNELAIVKDPLRDSRVYHLPREDGEVRCGINYRHGEWVTVPMDDVPDELDGCQRCPKASVVVDDSPPSLLKRARNGDPEDFGCDPIPR